MDLSDLFALGASIIDEVTETAQPTVQLSAWTGSDTYGAPTYATAISVQAIVDLKQRLRRLDSGQEVLQVASVTFPRPIDPNGATGRREPIDPRDKITLPNGYFGPILAIMGPVNPSTAAPYFLEVVLG